MITCTYFRYVNQGNRLHFHLISTCKTRKLCNIHILIYAYMYVLYAFNTKRRNAGAFNGKYVKLCKLRAEADMHAKFVLVA